MDSAMIPLLVEEGRGGGIDWKTQKKCARCHELIPTDVEPCRFPSSTAPASLAALNLHLGNEASWSTGPKVFCHKCWVWIYNLSICWACGETVVRGEEKVSYRWFWWHWACVCCMICRVGQLQCSSILLSPLEVGRGNPFQNFFCWILGKKKEPLTLTISAIYLESHPVSYVDQRSSWNSSAQAAALQTLH